MLSISHSILAFFLFYFFSHSLANSLFMLMQRTFVGVDSFSVFQEVHLRTDDPRVSNIVKFSDAIGELKVEV